ncbi:replication initiator protein A [Staphylococcus epidermidis]
MPIKYFKKKEQYQERFYQLPKVFFTNEIYKKLSLEAKVAYSILRDRLELSLQNDWVDSEENIYFIYTNENLMEILNLGKNKVVKIKKELESVNLLRQKRLGLNKPNMLYLIKPEVTKDDIYKIQNEEKPNKSTDDKEVYKANFQKLAEQTSGSLQNKLPEVGETNSNDTEFSDTEFSDTEFSDTHDMNDIYNIKSMSNTVFHSNHQSQTSDILSKQEEARYELQEFPERLATYLMNYSLSEIQIIKGIILKAKRSFHDERADEIVMPYTLENIEDELIDVLKRFRIILKKKNESVQSMKSYLMRCIKSEFEEIHVLTKRQQNMPKYNIFNT